MKSSALVAIFFSFFLSIAYAANAPQPPGSPPQPASKPEEVVDGSNIVDTGGSLSIVDDQEAQRLSNEAENRRQQAAEQYERMQQQQQAQPPQPGQPGSVPSSYGNPVSSPNPQAEGTPQAPTGAN